MNSVSTGVFSGYIIDGEENALQFTASISPGSSGGALFNDAGEVIGITFASFSEGQNLNLAIPIEEAEDLYNKTAGKIQPMSIQRFYNEIYRENIKANIDMDYDSFVEQIQFFNEVGIEDMDEILEKLVKGYRIEKTLRHVALGEDEMLAQLAVAEKLGIDIKRASDLIDSGYRFSYYGEA